MDIEKRLALKADLEQARLIQDARTELAAEVAGLRDAFDRLMLQPAIAGTFPPLAVGATLNLEASVRSRDTDDATRSERDFIEAGLN